MSSTSLIIVKPKQLKTRQAAKPKQPKAKRKVVQPSRPRLAGSPAQFKEFINTLNDPFNHGPVKLGFGCMTSSQTATAYYRGSFTANADGSFAVFMAPSCAFSADPIQTNASGISGTTWIGHQFTNKTAIQAAYQSARVVSGGIRVFCRQALTSAPGILFSGSLPSCTIAQAVALSPTAISNNQMFEMGSSISGATALTRPTSLQAYEFSPQTLDCGIYEIHPNSTVFVSGLGLPASTPIYYEAVLNFEALCCNVGTGMLLAAQEPSPGLTDYFPSLDQLWSATKNFIVPSGVPSMDLSGKGSRDAPGALHYFNHPATQRAFKLLQEHILSTREL